jgi:hypothetical protein
VHVRCDGAAVDDEVFLRVGAHFLDGDLVRGETPGGVVGVVGGEDGVEAWEEVGGDAVDGELAAGLNFMVGGEGEWDIVGDGWVFE